MGFTQPLTEMSIRNVNKGKRFEVAKFLGFDVSS
jgi:hypothetical protein